MPDYELWAPNDAVMRQALTELGFNKQGGTRTATGILFAVDYYGQKFDVTGSVTNPDGTTFYTYTAKPGVFANIRYVTPSAVFSLPTDLTSQGVTMTLQTAPYYHKWA